MKLSAKPGYEINSVTINGVNKTSSFGSYSGSYEFTMAENITVDVTFTTEDLTVVEIVTADEFDDIINREGKVIVYFYADWCGACTDTAPEVEEFAASGTGTKVIKIDYGNPPTSQADVTPEQNLFYKYSQPFASGSIIPLIMFFENGQPIAGVESSILPIRCETIVDLITNPDNYKK